MRLTSGRRDSSVTRDATDQVRAFAARSRNTMPNPTKNKTPQIKTGHHVPVAPETKKNTVATPRTTVTIVNRFQVIPSSIPVGATRCCPDYAPFPRRSKGRQPNAGPRTVADLARMARAEGSLSPRVTRLVDSRAVSRAVGRRGRDSSVADRGPGTTAWVIHWPGG